MRERERQPGEVVAGGDRREPDREREPRGAAEVDRALRRAGLRHLAARRRERLFVVEQGGRDPRRRDGKQLGTPFLDIRSQVTSGGEQGLLSIAFAPDYATQRAFYVYYTDKRRRRARRRVPARERRPRRPRLARGSCCGWPTRRPTTTAACCCSAPTAALHRHRRRRRRRATSTARAATRRTSARCSARSCGSTRGRRGGSPTRSPPTTRSSAAPARGGEIYAYGLRNPWRFSFDRTTGDLTIGDVGQDAVEEIDFVRRGKGRGANFGWRVVRGPRALHARRDARPARSSPVITRSHADGSCSITGGVVVRDPAAAGAARALRVRRLLPRRDPVGRLGAGAREAPCATRRLKVAQPVLVRRGRARARLRRLARRARSTGSSRGERRGARRLDIARVRRRQPGPLTLTGHQHVGRRPRPGVGGRPRPGDRRAPRRVAAAVEARGGAGGIALTHDHADHAEGAAGAARAARPPAGRRARSADVRLGDGDAFGPFAVRSSPGHARRPPRVRAGGAALHRRRRARRGQRVRRRPASREYLDGAAAPARARRCACICPGHGDAGAATRRRKLDEYLAHRARARAQAARRARGRAARARTSCSTPPGPTRPPALRPARRGHAARAPRASCASRGSLASA